MGELMGQKLLSICIPTRNRERYLESTLDNIASQALEFRDKVEICISSNASTDNTRAIVMKFKEKYPDMIKYYETTRNLGYDNNLLKVVSMAEGRFAWTFSDYSSIVDGGLKEVINFIETIEDKNVGLVGVRQAVYMFDEKDNKKLVLLTTVDINKPHVIEMNARDTAEKAFLRGITHVILNNNIIKKIYKENYNLLDMGVGSIYMHSWLYYIMFILNKNLDCYILNKVIVSTPQRPYKIIIEDYFREVCAGNIKFYGTLASICRERGDHELADIFDRIKDTSKRSSLTTLPLLKVINRFEYISYFGCIQMFSHCLKFKDALLHTLSFSISSITPSRFLKIMIKVYLKLKFGKNAEIEWERIIKPYIISTKVSAKGKTVLPYAGKDWRGDYPLTCKF